MQNLIGLNDTNPMYPRYFKRIIDILITSIALLLALPLFLVCYILVKTDSRGPFFFMQERLGYKGKIFRVFKIRTMTYKQRIANREIFKNDAEVTKTGSILRRFKIDEVPQLINVLKGDMSLVGPRPGLPAQISEFNDDGRSRLLVKPGLTGLAQINGNIYLSWPERWKYDRKYVENLSFLLDVKIILKTFSIIIQGEEKFVKKSDA